MDSLEESILQEYYELLRFPSVGAEPTCLRACVECAQWLKAWLSRLGFKARLESAPLEAGKAAPPLVWAERAGSEGAPTVLIYGHYDVQPVDPLAAWDTPPFEPTLREGRVYGRGAQDDKGQFFALLCGVRDFLAASKASSLVPTIKVILDGQEESGSSALLSFLPTWASRLAADILLVCDTSAGEALRPAIVAGLRGVGHFTLRLRAASRDLHSGEYGGVAPNPAQGLAELIASLHQADGAVAVAHFGDGIESPSAEERQAAEESTPKEKTWALDMGCTPAGGQKGKTLAERLSFEPTIEVNGFHAGYGGEGAKTIIPCEAMAKLSLRLVPGQSPQFAFAAVREHLLARVPEGMSLTFEDVDVGTAGFRLPLASPLFYLAQTVLSELDARGPVFVWDGASIPVVSQLRAIAGAAPLLVGWGQSEDAIHSPNESYSLRQFACARAWGRQFLMALVEQ